MHSAEVMVRNAVVNAKNSERFGRPRWACVVDILAIGSTSAFELCKKYGKDPDEHMPSCCDGCDLLEKFIKEEEEATA